jgi:hypothetical protein
MHTWSDINRQIRRIQTLEASVSAVARSALVCGKCGLHHEMRPPYSWNIATSECPSRRIEHLADGRFAVVGESDNVLHGTYEIWLTDVEASDVLVSGSPTGKIGPFVTVLSRTLTGTAMRRYNTEGFGAVQRARRKAWRWLRGEPEDSLGAKVEQDIKLLIDGIMKRGAM